MRLNQVEKDRHEVLGSKHPKMRGGTGVEVLGVGSIAGTMAHLGQGYLYAFPDNWVLDNGMVILDVLGTRHELFSWGGIVVHRITNNGLFSAVSCDLI